MKFNSYILRLHDNEISDVSFLDIINILDNSKLLVGGECQYKNIYYIASLELNESMFIDNLMIMRVS